MRFNDPAHLEAWKDHGGFPTIHAPFLNFIITHLTGKRVLDLGCSSGLLGQAIQHFCPDVSVHGIDADEKAIEAGKRAGIQMSMTHLRVTQNTSFWVADLCKTLHVTAVVARRVLPEIFGAYPAHLWTFAEQLHKAGVAQIFLQGRVAVPNPSNPLSDINKEIEALQGSYRAIMRQNDMALLTRIE